MLVPVSYRAPLENQKYKSSPIRVIFNLTRKADYVNIHANQNFPQIHISLANCL